MAQKKRSSGKKKKRQETVFFGVVLSAVRHERGLSQQALAEASGYTSNYISLLECGDSNPTLTALLRLARPLKIDASELVRRVEILEKQSK